MEENDLDYPDCDHTRQIPGKIQEEFLGEKFEADCMVCANCDARRWDAKNYPAFLEWRRELCKRKDIRDRMQVKNVAVTHEAFSYLEILKDKFSISDSKAISAVIVGYRSIREDVAFDAPLSHVRVKDKVHTFKVIRLSPYNYIDLQTQADLFRMEMSVALEEIVNRLLAVLLEDTKRFAYVHNTIELAASI